jgi:hypothetical protein
MNATSSGVTPPRRLGRFGRRLVWWVLLVVAGILISIDRDPMTLVAVAVAFAIGCASRPRIDRIGRRNDPAAPTPTPGPDLAADDAAQD